MEISIRLVLVATTGIITTMIVLFLFTGKATGLEEVLGGPTKDAKCKLWGQQWEDVEHGTDKARKLARRGREAGCSWVPGSSGGSGSGTNYVCKDQLDASGKPKPNPCGGGSRASGQCGDCGQDQVCCTS